MDGQDKRQEAGLRDEGWGRDRTAVQGGDKSGKARQGQGYGHGHGRGREALAQRGHQHEQGQGDWARSWTLHQFRCGGRTLTELT